MALMVLSAIETESAKYDLKLNYDKCNCIATDGKAHIHFSSGKPSDSYSLGCDAAVMFCAVELSMVSDLPEGFVDARRLRNSN